MSFFKGGIMGELDSLLASEGYELGLEGLSAEEIAIAELAPEITIPLLIAGVTLTPEIKDSINKLVEKSRTGQVPEDADATRKVINKINKNINESDRSFGFDDPPIPSRGIVDDEGIRQRIPRPRQGPDMPDFDNEFDLDIPEIIRGQAPSEPRIDHSSRAIPPILAGGLIAGAAGTAASIIASSKIGDPKLKKIFDPTPVEQPTKPRKGVKLDPPKKGQSEDSKGQSDNIEFKKGEKKIVPKEDVDTPIGETWLRPEFKMVGTEYFDKQFARTPLDVENSEWTEFNYYPEIDNQNLIDIDNVIADNIRFRSPLFLPKYQKKIKPPSDRSVKLTKNPMFTTHPLFQKFREKEISADMGQPITFSKQYNDTVFPASYYTIKTLNPQY